MFSNLAELRALVRTVVPPLVRASAPVQARNFVQNLPTLVGQGSQRAFHSAQSSRAAAKGFQCSPQVFPRGGTSTRGFAAAAEAAASSSSSSKYANLKTGLQYFLALGVPASVALQYFMQAPVENFYRRSFVTNKSADDLAEFYGSDEMMHIFCVFPFVVSLLMESGYWDDDGTYHTFGLPLGKMHVGIVFEEEERDSTGDGAKDDFSGYVKKERFHDTLFGFTLWDQTTNFGFQKLPNGQIECYQEGVYYYGIWPMRLVFQLHSIYVTWAIERLVNSPEFGSEVDPTADKLEIKERMVPLHTFKEFVGGLSSDLKQVETSVDGKTGALMENYKASLREVSDNLSQLEKTLDIYDANPDEHPVFGSHGPKFDKVKVFVRRVQVHGEAPSTELRMMIGDDDMRETVAAALGEVSRAERDWTARAVTPTWVDGKPVEPASQCWSRLVSSLLQDILTDGPTQKQTGEPMKLPPEPATQSEASVTVASPKED